MAAPCDNSKQQQLLGAADFLTKLHLFCTASTYARDISGVASSPLSVPLATGILGSTAASSQPSPSRGQGKAASPHSFQQLSSTHLKTALCWFFPPAQKAPGCTVLPREPRSQASLNTAGAMQSSASCSEYPNPPTGTAGMGTPWH